MTIGRVDDVDIAAEIDRDSAYGGAGEGRAAAELRYDAVGLNREDGPCRLGGPQQ